MSSSSRRNTLGFALALVVVVGAALAFFAIRSATRDRVDDLRARVLWPESCARIARSERVRWPEARVNATVSCEFLGPYFVYARFNDQAALRQALLTKSPSTATCLAGNEVLLDGLDGQDFEKLCASIHGRNVDAVSHQRSLPCTDCDTVIGNERAADRETAHDTSLEHRALAAFFRR